MSESKGLLNNSIKFYRANGKYGFLSNLYKEPVFFEGKWWDTAEHAYQFGKFRDKEIAEWVMSAPKPHLVSVVGHGIFAFDITPNWSKIKVERMKNILHSKFSLNQELKKKLIETEDSILIENSKTDNFWGIGPKFKGKNMLGKLLMEIREKLQMEA